MSSEERKGPRVGAPEQAIDGFLKAAGLTPSTRRRSATTRRAASTSRRSSAGAPDGRGGRRDRAGHRVQLPLAQVHALGRRHAALGAAAALHPLPARRQGRAVRDRRHRRAARRRAATASWRPEPFAVKDFEDYAQKLRDGLSSLLDGEERASLIAKRRPKLAEQQVSPSSRTRACSPRSPGWSNGRWC